MKKEHLKKTYNQLKQLELGLLLAGLTVLVKDTADYINGSGITDEATEDFREAYLEMLNHDRYYWTYFGPDLFRPLSDTGLPSGFARGAAECNLNLEPLSDPEIEDEWTRAPGWHFFENYTGRIKNDILGNQTLEQWKDWFFTTKDPKTNCDIDPFEPVAALAEKLAKRSKFGPAFWYPLILYVIALLEKTGFRTLT